MSSKDDLIKLGRISSVFGVKGWVKVFSFTEPMDQILDYSNWLISKDGSPWREIKITSGRSHGKGMVVHIEGVDDREIAKTYGGFDVAVSKDQLPELEDGDFYWHQLEGMQVNTTTGVNLGNVNYLINAGGANDVLVVKQTKDSIDKRERMIPYLLDQTVIKVDLEERLIEVDWDPEF